MMRHLGRVGPSWGPVRQVPRVAGSRGQGRWGGARGEEIATTPTHPSFGRASQSGRESEGLRPLPPAPQAEPVWEFRTTLGGPCGIMGVLGILLGRFRVC